MPAYTLIDDKGLLNLLLGLVGPYYPISMSVITNDTAPFNRVMTFKWGAALQIVLLLQPVVVVDLEFYILYITLTNNFIEEDEGDMKGWKEICISTKLSCLPSFDVCFASNFSAVRPADLTAVGQIVRRHIPEAVFLESIGQEITYILPYGGARDGTFALLFQELDLAMADLGLTSYGISDTTLEEVY